MDDEEFEYPHLDAPEINDIEGEESDFDGIPF